MRKELHLNAQQKEAVDTTEGPLLIIAGAGSGKTGVVTSRIVNLIEKGVSPSDILALTFTNKAANEMKKRIQDFSNSSIEGLNVSTFHAFGVKFINENKKKAGCRPGFTIYDLQDKLACIKKAFRELNIPVKSQDMGAMAALFGEIKTRRISWGKDIVEYKPLYKEYQVLLKLYNAVDFDDLILRPLEILETEPEILKKYRTIYRYILVDEFQDTSGIQYQIVKHLAEEHRNLCCVGDDDQSIYSWRGADFTNILNFEKDFPERKEIKLERNYRSTGTILKAANALIRQNTDRKEKVLWTENNHDEVTISLSFPSNENEEGQIIAEKIASLKAQGYKYSQIGILLRTNSTMRAIEKELLSFGIPYNVSGGTSFFSRQEIKDMLAYLRLICNPDNDVSFLRIVNTPRRGIGKVALSKVVEQAKENQSSLYNALCKIVRISDESISKDTQECLADFMNLIEKYKDLCDKNPKERPDYSSIFQDLIEEVNYWEYLLHEFRDKEKVAKWRYDNIMMLSDFMERWENSSKKKTHMPMLSSWLNRLSLNTRDELNVDDESKVSLMTIHASKGLEFETVFLAGVEAGLIPHAKSVGNDPRKMEEERRLFYVAITRAKKRLCISSCRSRKVGADRIESIPSSFLDEIPKELLEEESNKNELSSEEDVDAIFAKAVWKS